MSTTPGPRRTSISLWEAALPLAAMVLLFGIGAIFLELGQPLIIMSMLGAATVAGISAFRMGHGWDDIQNCTGEKLASILPAFLILLSIGLLIGTWVLSGTIPTLVAYGLRLVDPAYMVLTAFVATSLMSLCTGTSWGSAGTVGVALMGMAAAMNAPLSATAGAIVSGAYLGDKMSPLSDSTNICAIGAGADLYAHIRNMTYTALPSAALAAVVFAFASGLPAGSESGLPAEALQLLDELGGVFRLGLWTLIPLLIVLVGVLGQRPPALVMVVSSVAAMLVGILVQGFSFVDAINAGVRGFDLAMLSTLGQDPTAMGDLARTLLNRGGMTSMASTILVIISAFLLAAGMDLSGALDRLVSTMLATVDSTFGVVASSMASGALLISMTSHGSVTALIVGGLFQKPYREERLAPQNLSRSLEDSVTIVEPLMPWTVSAVFMASTLGVSTVEYLPWAVFCMGGPVFSLLYALTFDRTGFGLVPIRSGGSSPDEF